MIHSCTALKLIVEVDALRLVFTAFGKKHLFKSHHATYQADVSLSLI